MKLKSFLNPTHFGVLFFISLLFSCSDTLELNQNSEDLAPLGIPTTLGPNSDTFFKDEDGSSIKVTTLSITDGRCNEDSFCIGLWGLAFADFQIGDYKKIYTLYVGGEDYGPKPGSVIVLIKGQYYTLKIIDIVPHSTTTNPNPDKVVEFQLNKM